MAKLRADQIRTGMCFVNKTTMMLTLRRLGGGGERPHWVCVGFSEVTCHSPGDRLWNAGIPINIYEGDLSEMEYAGAIPHMKDLMAGALTSGIYPQTPEHQKYDQEDQEADNF